MTVGALEEWARAGAHWRVLAHTGDRVTVELCTCLGEPVEQVSSEDPELITFLAGARSDLDLS